MHAADIQDRDGGELVMATLFGLYPFLLRLYADGGYQGPVFRRAVTKIMTQVNVEIVKRSDHAKGFVVLPLYHPAAALYNGGMRKTLLYDFQKIPLVLKKIGLS